jgi:hypothetical protein
MLSLDILAYNRRVRSLRRFRLTAKSATTALTLISRHFVHLTLMTRNLYLNPYCLIFNIFLSFYAIIDNHPLISLIKTYLATNTET